MGLGREGRAVFSPSCMQMDGGGWRSWWIIDVVREAAAKKEVRFKNNKKASCRKNICFIVKTKNQIENPLWIFIQPKVTWKFTVRCFFKLGDHFGPWRSPAVSPSMRWFHWVHWLRMHHPTVKYSFILLELSQLSSAFLCLLFVFIVIEMCWF